MNHSVHQTILIALKVWAKRKVSGTSLRCARRYYSQMSIAAGLGPEGAGILGDICGREAAAFGINWAFAPVSDIDLNFRNPITNTRTYGSDPEMVRNCVVDYIRRCQAHGVAATAKHFPGDGCDERDQHLVTTINDLSVEDWDRTYGMIYRSAIEADVLTIMTGHIMQPAWSKKLNPTLKDEDIKPASLSRELLSGLLRDRLGFNGLIVTDATTMAGFNCVMPRESAVPASIAAGADMFLFTKNLEEDFAYMKKGIRDGIVSKERLDEAVTRILATKAALRLFGKSNIPDLEAGLKLIEEDSELDILKRNAEASITLVKDKQDVFPIVPSKYPRILYYPIDNGSGQIALYGSDVSATDAFRTKLEKQGFHVDIFEPTPGIEGLSASSEEIKKGYDLIIYCVNIATKSNQTTVRIEWQEPMGANVPSYCHTVPTVFISRENPYHLLDVPRVKTYINTYQSDDMVLDVLIEKLMGKSEFRGKSPVDAFCGKWDTRL